MNQLFRYEIDYANDIEGSETKLYLREYEILSETEKGYWFSYNGKKKRMSKNKSHKRTAHITKEEAMKGLLWRCKKRISWYKFRIENCENAIILCNRQIEMKDYPKYVI